MEERRGEAHSVRDSVALHVLDRMRVNDLIAQGSEDKVRLLRDKEDLLIARLNHNTALQWPKFTKDAEERGLATAIGSSNHNVRRERDFKVEV